MQQIDLRNAQIAALEDRIEVILGEGREKNEEIF